MLKNLLALCIFLHTFSAGAYTDSVDTKLQLDYKAGVGDQDLKHGLLLRGKAIYWAIFEDLFWLNYSAGMEFRFFQHHSLGVDYIFFEKFEEQEQFNDTTDLSNYDEYRQKFPRHSLHVDYRFYFSNWKFFQNSPITPYVNIFGKYGKAGIFAESEFDYRDGDVVRQWETFYDIGGSLGAHIGDECWGLDVNLGLYKRFMTQDIVTYSATHAFDYVYDKKSSIIRPGMRINLFFYLWTK